MTTSGNDSSVSLAVRAQRLMDRICTSGDIVMDQILRDFEEIESTARKKAFEEAAAICDAEVESDPGGLGGRAYNCARKIRARAKEAAK